VFRRQLLSKFVRLPPFAKKWQERLTELLKVSYFLSSYCCECRLDAFVYVRY